jgi:hypothetical protein
VKLFNPADVCISPDALLRTTDNPRHRAMIENYRRHAMLEVAGRWQEILQDDMIVKEPEYRMFYMGQSMTLTGRDQVSTFYRDFDASGGTVFGPLEERMAVADWGLALESYFGHHLRGYQLEAMGVEVPDSGGFYQFEHWLSSFWPYDENCLLIGEHIYEHAGSRVLHEIDEREFVTPARAAELLAPLIDG